MSFSDRMKFTKQGLLDIAGSRPVRAYATPYENAFREVSPLQMPLKDYCGFLDERDTDLQRCKTNFSYVFERLSDDEGPLSFARSPPKLFKENIKLRSAQFTLGGQLMGSAAVKFRPFSMPEAHCTTMWMRLGSQVSWSSLRRRGELLTLWKEALVSETSSRAGIPQDGGVRGGMVIKKEVF